MTISYQICGRCTLATKNVSSLVSTVFVLADVIIHIHYAKYLGFREKFGILKKKNNRVFLSPVSEKRKLIREKGKKDFTPCLPPE